jgi:hypothetical protein
VAAGVSERVALRNLVVILGAGASVSSGLPSLAGIFDDDVVQKYLAARAADFEEFLEKYVWKPRGIALADRWKSLNLEEVLTMLRLWEKDNQSPVNFKKNYGYQKDLLGCVYHSVFIDRKDNGCRDLNNLIAACDGTYDGIAWGSFNWDAKLEQAFYYQFLHVLPVSSRLPVCHPVPRGWDGAFKKHLLLKLHGSVTWFIDKKGEVHYKPYGTKISGNETKEAWDAFLSRGSTDLEPMIAEPSFLKHERIKAIQFLCEQWREFDRCLAKADLVLIVGYSLPDGDAMAKQSLLTAVARRPDARYIIVDPDRDSQVLRRYSRVLGNSRIVPHRVGLSEFLADKARLATLTNP